MDIAPLINWIETIPNVIWSGVIASFITLSGVMLSNWSNTRRLRLQLEHDRVEKSKERLAIMRREVYLSTTSELARATNHLANFPQLDPTTTNLADGLQGFFSSAAKLQLIAESDTAQHASNLVALLGNIVFQLISKVQPIHDLQIQINTQAGMYERAQNEVNRILAQITQFNESGGTDDRVFQALYRSFEFNQSQMTQFGNARDNLSDRKFELHKEFVAALLAETMPFHDAQLPLLAALRKELELHTDTAAQAERLDQRTADFQRQIVDFLGRLK